MYFLRMAAKSISKSSETLVLTRFLCDFTNHGGFAVQDFVHSMVGFLCFFKLWSVVLEATLFGIVLKGNKHPPQTGAPLF